MTASLRVEVPAGLPVRCEVFVAGTPAQPGERTSVEPGPTTVELRLHGDGAAWRLRGSAQVAVDVPEGGAVRVAAPGLYWLKTSAV